MGLTGFHEKMIKLLCRLSVYASAALLILCAKFSAAQSAGANLVPNGNFRREGEGWKRYIACASAERDITDWSLEFRDGAAIITGNDCQPQGRVGFRSEPISLASLDFKSTLTLHLEFQWEGKYIHRGGMYINAMRGLGSKILGNELTAPTGDFSQKVIMPLLLDGTRLTPRDSLILYFFHDGIGELKIRDVSLRLSRADDGWRTGLDAAQIPAVFMPPLKDVSGYFPKATADALKLLLNGEKRLFLIKDETPPKNNFAIKSYNWRARQISPLRDFAVVQERPFWLKPASDDKNAPLCEIELKDPSAALSLPPLPDDYNVYLYYWGRNRYGKTLADLEKDEEELAFIKTCGFTGICFQDDYGLDFRDWIKGAPLNPLYLRTIAKSYDKLAFRSPMMFAFTSGVELGDETIESTHTKTAFEYFKRASPFFEDVRSQLKGRLLLGVADEPNDARRMERAKKNLPHWTKLFGRDSLVIPGTWKVALHLGEWASPWVGAGDYPDFASLRKTRISGFYKVADAHIHPLVMRRIAGLHAWAGGFRTQVYWHYAMAVKNKDSDLDGKAPDVLLVDPDSREAEKIRTIPMAQIMEGLQDLRLLFALEALAASKEQGASEVQEFLERLRARIPAGDQADSRWDEPEEFETFRQEGARLWLKHSAK